MGPLELDAPDRGRRARPSRSSTRSTNGLASSRGTVTLRTAEPYNNPPVGLRRVRQRRRRRLGRGRRARDGLRPGRPEPRTSWWPRCCRRPASRPPSDGSTITVTRGDQPVVVPFRVEDADGGATTASLYVPPADDGLPYVPDGRPDRGRPGRRRRARPRRLRREPVGRPAQFTLKNRIWASPVDRGRRRDHRRRHLPGRGQRRPTKARAR